MRKRPERPRARQRPTSSSSPPRERYLLRGLLQAYYWYDESLQNLVAARGYRSLTRAQSMIMVNISAGIRRPADLARRLGISRQAIQQTIAELVRIGLLSLNDDPLDRRAKVVGFSSRGQGIVREAFSAIARIESELESRLGPRAKKALESALYADWGPVLDEAAALRAARRPAKPKR